LKLKEVPEAGGVNHKYSKTQTCLTPAISSCF
jgi:hypothetical protein